MDTAKLELAVQRLAEAQAATEAARADVRQEVADVLREGGAEGYPEVARITGWAPETVRRWGLTAEREPSEAPA